MSVASGRFEDVLGVCDRSLEVVGNGKVYRIESPELCQIAALLLAEEPAGHPAYDAGYAMTMAADRRRVRAMAQVACRVEAEHPLDPFITLSSRHEAVVIVEIGKCGKALVLLP